MIYSDEHSGDIIQPVQGYRWSETLLVHQIGVTHNMSLVHFGYALSWRVVKGILCITFFLFLSVYWWETRAQCELMVSSTDGYDIDLVLDPVAIQAPMSCPNGYNFKVRVEYDIDFGGSNPPPSLWTLQGNIHCGSIQNVFFNLPNDGGSGFVLTSNAWNPASNCATATPESLDCSTMEIIIQGPGIPYQTIQCHIVLPIRLIEFEGNTVDDGVELQWTTAYELNNKEFTVERSHNAIEWTPIESVPAKGHATQLTSYSVIDSNPYSGTTYYRLKQTDEDGQSTYSNVVAIHIKDWTESQPNIYPNPARHTLKVANTGPIRALVNTLGEDCKSMIEIEEINHSCLKIDISSLREGVYLLKTDHIVEKVYILNPW